MSQAALVNREPVSAAPPPPTAAAPVLATRDLKLYYGDFQALNGITLAIPRRQVTAFIGPSGCGKSTLLRTFNRMNDRTRGVRIEGEVRLEDNNIYAPGTNLIALRKRVGMVFQRPNPFPITVFENVAYGPRVHGAAGRSVIDPIVEKSLRATGLWDELKDRLHEPALALSAEQQQRLCISRLLAVEPEVVLMDEPCSALDPMATAKVEELLVELAKDYTVIIVTHNMQQAARVSAFTAYFLLGDMIEFGPTSQIFTAPKQEKTEQYITGRFG